MTGVVIKRLERVHLRVPEGTEAKWKAAAKERGITLTALIENSVERSIKRRSTR